MNARSPLSELDDAADLVADIQPLLHKAAASIRKAAARLDVNLATALDQFQIPAFELAHMQAELHAAGSIIDYARRCEAQSSAGDDKQLIETRLAGAFVAETVLSVRSRFEKVRRMCGLSTVELAACFDGAAADEFLARHLDPEFLDRTGEMIVTETSNGRSLLDEDKKIIASSFARLAEEVVAPAAERIHREDLTVPEEIIRALSEMGCFALSVPEEFGGSAPETGQDNLAMCVVTEELSRASLAAAGSPLTRPEIAARAIMAGAHEPQKRAWLPGIAAGKPLVAIAVTEPDCGSDVAAVRLRASRAEGGWRLDGAKTWCTFAGMAGLLVVLARTDPDFSRAHRGLSLFLVEKEPTDAKSFETRQPDGGSLSGQAIPTIGYRGMHSFTLFFDNFFVPDANLIGGPDGEGRGFYLTMQAFAGGRLQTAARACGVMQAAFDAALTYASHRKVFGRTLDGYQLTRAKLVSMAAKLRACQEMTYAVARLMDEGCGQTEASLVKLYACRAAEFITREALQIHGGMGYAEETAVSRYFVDARVLSIFEGAEETLALKVIARDLLGTRR